MTPNSLKNNLIRQVHEAFDDVKPPALDSGVEISFSYDTERQDLAAFLNGKDWKEITFETVSRSYHHQSSAIVFFLTEEGFHYYFPAFLLISLNIDGAGLDDQLSESSIVPFAGLYSDKDNQFYRDRVSRLSMQQLQVTETVFKYIWEKRRQEIIDEGEDFDSKLIHIEMEDLETALKGVRRAISEKQANVSP
jgi:hypothetical protein